MRALIGTALAAFPALAHAHGGLAHTSDSRLLIVALLALSLWLYARGTVQLWRSAGYGRGVRYANAACFAGGLVALAFALLSPLDEFSEHLFSAHMLQHELLMLVAAPLLVLGRPLATWAWGVSEGVLECAASFVHGNAVRDAWSFITRPLSAWCIHAAVVWTWHAPALFAAAQSSGFVHALQHASFLFSALLFWWSVLGARSGALGHGVAVFYLFMTMIHTGALGALLVFSGELWYPFNSPDAASWGLTPLEDQQFGGLMMWIPGGLVYFAAAIVVMFRCLAALSARASPAWDEVRQ